MYENGEEVYGAFSKIRKISGLGQKINAIEYDDFIVYSVVFFNIIIKR